MKIPRDLKPGDRLWYSKTEYAIVGFQDDLYEDDLYEGLFCGSQSVLWATRLNGKWAVYHTEDGCEVDRATDPIIRIERIASKPVKPKRDADAAWLRGLALVTTHMPSEMSKSAKARLRRIAKRLEGGAQ